MMILRPLVALSFVLGAAIATAQTPAPAPAPATAVTVPASTCVKPAKYPGSKATEARKTAWQNDVKAWGDCVKVYVADLRAQIDARIKTANTTIEDYNTALKELQAEQMEPDSSTPPANTKPK